MEREQAKQIASTRGWLALLPPDVRNAVLLRTVLRRFRKGEVIYTAQDPPAGMFGLVSGFLGVMIAPDNSSPQFVHTALPGFWFGEGSVITGEPRRIGTVARSDVSTLHLPLPAIQDLTAADPSFWRHIALNAVLNLDVALRAYHDAKLRNPEVRIAAILLRLCGYQTPWFRPDETNRVGISQSELAEMAALSRNLVNLVLARFAEAGVVSIGYGFVDIVEPERLAGRLAEG